MMSVIAFTTTGEAGRASLCRRPAIPHMRRDPPWRQIWSILTFSDLRLGAALRHLGDVTAPPLDQARQAIVEIDRRLEADFFFRANRRTDAIAHQRRLAARSV